MHSIYYNRTKSQERAVHWFSKKITSIDDQFPANQCRITLDMLAYTVMPTLKQFATLICFEFLFTIYVMFSMSIGYFRILAF